jgi:hypothetical protein
VPWVAVGLRLLPSSRDLNRRTALDV